MKDMIPSFPPDTEFPGAACALPICASRRFAELKCRRDEGYGSLIPTGHRTSLCGLCLAAIFRGFSGNGRVGGMNDKLHSLQTATEIPCLNFAKPTRTSGLFGDLKCMWNEGYDSPFTPAKYLPSAVSALTKLPRKLTGN
jgi:hypothetical protein